ncbi:MAG TPA: carboxypeptidase-like regulatory domain-containing protein [Methanocella sp.]
MKKVFIAVLLLAALALFAMPSSAAQYDKLRMDASQSYLRLGFNDTVNLTVHLLEQGNPSGAAGVNVLIRFKTGEEYINCSNYLIVTDSMGDGTTTISLKTDNQPQRVRLPLLIWAEAVVMGNDGISASNAVYITSTGPIKGFVVDDNGGVITGARITATTPDGNIFQGGPFISNERTPMGEYRIDDLPLLPNGLVTLAADKNGYTGVKRAEPGFEGSTNNNIVLSGYHDTVDVPSIVIGNANATVTPTPEPENSETPTKPTTMTTTILIAIALITLVYIGLKAYRRMF